MYDYLFLKQAVKAFTRIFLHRFLRFLLLLCHFMMYIYKTVFVRMYVVKRTILKFIHSNFNTQAEPQLAKLPIIDWIDRWIAIASISSRNHRKYVLYEAKLSLSNRELDIAVWAVP